MAWVSGLQRSINSVSILHLYWILTHWDMELFVISLHKCSAPSRFKISSSNPFKIGFFSSFWCSPTWEVLTIINFSWSVKNYDNTTSSFWNVQKFCKHAAFGNKTISTYRSWHPNLKWEFLITDIFCHFFPVKFFFTWFTSIQIGWKLQIESISKKEIWFCIGDQRCMKGFLVFRIPQNTIVL